MVNSKPWLNHYSAKVPLHIEYPQIPLQEILQKSALAYPEKTAIAYGEREISYAELDALSNQFANSLIELDLRKRQPCRNFFAKHSSVYYRLFWSS